MLRINNAILNNTLQNNIYCFTNKIDYDSLMNIYFRCRISRKNIFVLLRIIEQFNSQYESVKRNKKHHIDLHISSDGGDCSSGLLAYDVLKSSKLPVYTHGKGIVASSATLIFLAGGKRTMTQHSNFLIHQLSSSMTGTYKNMKDEMYNYDMIMNNMKNIYLKETKIDKKTLEKLLTHDIFLNSTECLKNGIIHEIK